MHIFPQLFFETLKELWGDVIYVRYMRVRVDMCDLLSLQSYCHCSDN